MTNGAPVGVVDCGTNSTRLLVADADGRELARLMRITRLGEGVDSAGELAAPAIERTLAVLGEYRSVMDALGVGRVRAIATSAARDARSAGTFLDAAESVLGTRPEILDGETEGRLAFAGATRRLPSSGAPYLVVDIGGGSTEVVLGPGPLAAAPPPRLPGPPHRPSGAPIAAVSLDLGCVRVTERYLAHDPPLASELDEAAAAVSAELSRAAAAVPGIAAAATMVGLAGTVTTLATVAAGLRRHDPVRTHHVRLSRGQVEAMLAELAAETREQRLLRPGMEPGRVDVIVGGALVLAQVMSCFGFADCLVSEEDILDGLAATLLASKTPEVATRRDVSPATDEETLDRRARWLRLMGWYPQEGSPVVVIEESAGGLAPLAAELARVLPVVLVGSAGLAGHVASASKGDLYVPEQPLSMEDVAAACRSARAVVGSSVEAEGFAGAFGRPYVEVRPCDGDGLGPDVVRDVLEALHARAAPDAPRAATQQETVPASGVAADGAPGGAGDVLGWLPAAPLAGSSDPSILARSLAARGRAVVAERLGLAEALALARRECTGMAKRLEDLRSDSSKALGALADDFGRATAELAELEAELAHVVAERDELAARLEAVCSTRLFRWSAPLRRLYGLARRLL